MNAQPLSRRTFLLQSSLACALAPAILTRAQAPAITTASPTRTISHLPHRYHGWPTVARRKNGQLVLAYSGGRESHVCPFGRVELMQSDSEGQHWTWPRIIHDGAIDDRDAGILETPQGTLIATTFSSLAYESILDRQQPTSSWSSDRLAAWNAVQRRLSSAARQAQLGQWTLRSTDGGTTWSTAARCPVNSPHGPISLRDGRLLYAGKELWTGQRRIGVCQSLDDGVTWQWLATIPTRPGDDPAEYHELHAIETADRRILVQIRNHNRHNARETLQTESPDGGHTWTQPKSIGVWGLPSHLLRLRDQRLLMTYGYRRHPFGNQARISEDHGHTWSEPITLSADGHSGDLGYPSTVQLTDDSLLTVWYEQLANQPKAVLRQAHWRLT